jgi:hypothetical protein
LEDFFRWAEPNVAQTNCCWRLNRYLWRTETPAFVSSREVSLAVAVEQRGQRQRELVQKRGVGLGERIVIVPTPSSMSIPREKSHRSFSPTRHFAAPTIVRAGRL